MNKYFGLTVDYIKKNWKSVLMHVLIPAIFYTIFVNPTSSFDFIMEKINGLEADTYADIFKMINDSTKWSSWEYAVMFFGTAIVTVILFSSFIGRVQNKMRYGDSIYHGFSGLLKRTNENLWTTFQIAIVVFVGMELFAFAMSLIIFLTIKITTIAAIRIFIIIFACVLFLSLMFYGLAWATCVVPNMAMRGIGLFKSIALSMKTMTNYVGSAFLTFAVPMFISYMPLIIFSALDIEYNHIALTIVRYIYIGLFYLFSFTYYLVAIYAIFFDVNDLDREDLNLEKKWGMK